MCNYSHSITSLNSHFLFLPAHLTYYLRSNSPKNLENTWKISEKILSESHLWIEFKTIKPILIYNHSSKPEVLDRALKINNSCMGFVSRKVHQNYFQKSYFESWILGLWRFIFKIIIMNFSFGFGVLPK